MGQAAEIGYSLAALKLGQPLTYMNLTHFPLIGDGVSASGCVLLDEALDRHLVRSLGDGLRVAACGHNPARQG